MKKILFCLFAHPDDESFGVAGTLLTERATGTEIHLVTLTEGESGRTEHAAEELGDTRARELEAACTLMDLNSWTMWDYQDGMLSNTDMLHIAQRFEDYVKEKLKSKSNDTVIEFMSFDTTGLSGHIDHIVASRAICLVFYRLKTTEPRLKRLRLRCLSAENYPIESTEWLFMEKGRSPEEINETIDARAYLEQIHAVMQAHRSQQRDYEYQVATLGDNIAINHFVVKT